MSRGVGLIIFEKDELVAKLVEARAMPPTSAPPAPPTAAPTNAPTGRRKTVCDGRCDEGS